MNNQQKEREEWGDGPLFILAIFVCVFISEMTPHSKDLHWLLVIFLIILAVILLFKNFSK